MTQVLLIADDLTGALDSGVAFAAPGRRVLVARTVGAARALMAEAPDVLVVSTGTRDGTARDAAAAMVRLCQQIDPAAFDVVIKKVDSRLKGHVGAETAALAGALSDRSIVVAPAIPSMGRIQRDGAVCGHGLSDPIAVAPLFDRPVQVPDVTDDAELDAVARMNGPALWVGARGLAFALARKLQPGAATPAPALRRPILLAIGSRDPVTCAQTEALRRTWSVHEAPDGNVGRVAGTGDVTVIRMSDGGSGQSARDAGNAFARSIASCMGARLPATLLACGGETADAILAQLEIDRLELVAEVAPGLPVSSIRTEQGTCLMVTKSGGFGAPDLLEEIVQAAAPCETGEIAR